MTNKSPVVYIMANQSRTTYVGVTSDLFTRVWQHKYKSKPDSFTGRYNINKLVYFAEFARVDDAIAFEKKLKGKDRAFKLALIEDKNPRWNDLAWNWFED